MVGACCDMLANPWGALLAGTVAGGVSVYGFSYLVPALKRRGLTDTCGISSLHFMPGLIGGVASAIAAAGVTGPDWDEEAIMKDFSGRASGRSALTQGGYQMAMTAISLAFGALSGAFAGWAMRQPFADPQTDAFYEDAGEKRKLLVTYYALGWMQGTGGRRADQRWITDRGALAFRLRGLRLFIPHRACLLSYLTTVSDRKSVV